MRKSGRGVFDRSDFTLKELNDPKVSTRAGITGKRGTN
jgi:hypothetical protein